MKTRILTIIICLVICSGGYAQSMFGHINSQEIISAMPEAATAQMELQMEMQKLQTNIQDLTTEYESIVNDFQVNQGNMSDIIRETKIKEIQDYEQRIAVFQQTAQQELTLKEAELFEPILNKIQAAIDKVAEKNGYLYIFDVGGNAGNIVYKNDSFDLTKKIKAELNL